MRVKWSRTKDRPPLYIVSWTLDLTESPGRIVLWVESVPVVRETRCRWYLGRESRISRRWNPSGAAYIPKDHSGTLFVASKSKAAALRRFARLERVEAERHTSLGKDLMAMVNEAEQMASRGPA